jgi:hypothetical protein
MRAATVVFLLAVVALAAPPAAAIEGYDGTRALGMGGATRAWALGDSALLLNPSGMSLAKIYNIEAGYGYGSRLSEQALHVSIVDSTSATTLAGGVYYTYHWADPDGRDGHTHEVGAALSLPVGDRLAMGGTLKWFHFEGVDADPAAPAIPPATSGGFTFDAGVTVRPLPVVSFGVVGANLVDRHNGLAPRQIGYGAAFVPIKDVVVTADGLTTLTRDPVTGREGTGVRAGGEAVLAQRVAVRIGGGTDSLAGAGYLAAGASLLSEVGAIDAGIRGDLFPYAPGASRHVILGVSLRLFVPAAVASAEPAEPPIQ